MGDARNGSWLQHRKIVLAMHNVQREIYWIVVMVMFFLEREAILDIMFMLIKLAIIWSGSP